MKEDYLHYLWQYQKFEPKNLCTTNGHALHVLSPGTHNTLSGPDFFNARLKISNQEWAGNVEIHIRASDWYLHGHEHDKAYDNVILHVVWVNDVEIFRRDNSAIPVLELEPLISREQLSSYERLYFNKDRRWINCAPDIGTIDLFHLNQWQERLFVERLEKKTALVQDLLEKLSGNWEAVLFHLLAKNFGLNINGEAFLSIARSFPFSVVRKIRGNGLQLEALLLGQAGLLQEEQQEPYYQELHLEYEYLKTKYKFSSEGVLPVQFFRLRPDNFPHLRLVQLAALYHKQPSLFKLLDSCGSREEVFELMSVTLPDFWNTHYTFAKSHAFRKKKLTKKFVDLILINTWVSIKFCYQKSRGNDNLESIFDLIREIPPEENEIIKKFEQLKPGLATNAFETQALLHLKKEYCDKKACLQCAVGVKILQRHS